MAKAGLTIAISGTYNGRALEKARQDLEKMKISAVSELGGAGSSLVNFGARAAEVGGEIHNMGYHMEQVGKKATAGLTVPLVAAAAACGKAAIDIDDALTGVRKTVNMTEEGYQNLKQSAIEYSKTNAISATDILLAEELAGQLGVANENLESFAHVATGLDIATNMNVEQASTNLARFANVTNMAKLEGAAAERAYQAYGNVIVGLGNNLATTESEISDFSLRMASAGTQAGMTEPEILGIAGAMSSLGLEAQAGGSAFSKTITEISVAVATGSDDLGKYAAVAGKSAEDFAQSWRDDAAGAFIEFVNGLASSSEDMNVVLEDLGITELRQSDALRRLAGNTKLLTDSVELANEQWRDGSALTDEVANKNAAFSARLQMLQNKVIAVAESVGTPLVDALLDMIDAAEPLIETVADAARGFSEMDKDTQQLIIRMGAAAAAFGPVMTGAGKLTQGFGNLIVGFGRGAQSLGMLKNELGLLRSATSAQIGPTLTLGQAVNTMGATNLPMVTGALGAVKTAMIGLGIGAAVVAIGAVVGALVDWYQHEKKVEEATIGLETAMGAAQDAYDSYVGGAENAAKSLGDIKAQTEEVIESQGKLAQSMADTWADYGTDAAMVDAYAQEIQNLTQKYDEHGNKLQLTEEEQTRLKLAVDGFNEATGASVQVTDALNGTLDQSVDSIMASAEAFKEQARAQAAIEMYKDLYKQQLQDEMALNDATAELNRLKELEADAWAYSYEGINPYSSQVAEAQRQVDELTRAMDSNIATQDQLIGVIMGTGQTFDSFDAALEQSGIAMEDFGTLTDEQLAALQSNFDGKLSSIVTTCNEQGIAIPQTLADAISSNKDAVNEPAQGLGEDVNAGIQQGIESTADQPKSAIATVGDGIIDFFKDLFGIHSPSTVMAELGKDIDLGIKQGIEGSQGEPTDAISALGELVQGAIDGLPDWMKGLGSDAGNLLSNGLSSLRGAVQSAGGLLYNSAKDGTNPLTNALGTIGRQAGNFLTSGLNSLRSAAMSAGGNLYSSAKSGTNPVISALGTIGSQAASSFSNVIARTSAYGSGQSLAVTARNGMGSVDTYNTGYNFTQGFANGMGGVSIWNAAYNIGRSALGAIKSALGIASPSKEAAKVGAWFGEGAIVGMKSTEEDIAAESRRMSEAMSLNPEINAGYGASGSYATSYQAQASQGRQIAFNVTINVTARDEQQAAGIGRSIGDELFLEFARRERAYA